MGRTSCRLGGLPSGLYEAGLGSATSGTASRSATTAEPMTIRRGRAGVAGTADAGRTGASCPGKSRAQPVRRHQTIHGAYNPNRIEVLFVSYLKLSLSDGHTQVGCQGVNLFTPSYGLCALGMTYKGMSFAGKNALWLRLLALPALTAALVQGWERRGPRHRLWPAECCGADSASKAMASVADSQRVGKGTVGRGKNEKGRHPRVQPFHQPSCFPPKNHRLRRENGAGEGIRTLDPNLGKVVLYP